MKHLIGLAGIILFISGPVAAQNEIRSRSYVDTLEVYEGLFKYEDPLHLTMKFNARQFRRTKRQDKYQPAELTNHVNDSFHITHPVRIKARGIFRLDYCTTPPFWLNIRYSGIETEELKNIRKMKMVTKCKSSKSYNDYLLREYMVYKIYNIITPNSFRVRLVRLSYVDTGSKKNRTSEDWAFLIEPEEMLAERLDAKVIESDKMSMRTTHKQSMDQMAMFQYMIGNGDYSVTGRHNLKLLALPNPAIVGFVPVPYDFDYTGLVNTEYAIPGETLGIKSVRERYFLGPCRAKSLYLNAINRIVSFRDEINDLILNFEYLDEDAKMDMIGFLETFFVAAEDEDFIEDNITITCR